MRDYNDLYKKETGKPAFNQFYGRYNDNFTEWLMKQLNERDDDIDALYIELAGEDL